MAKKKAPHTTLHTGHIPKLYAYAKQGTVTPTVLERYTGEEWVYFGKRNLWPEDMRSLADNCGPLERCVHTTALMIAGNGVKFYDKAGKEVEEARTVLNDELLKDTTEEAFLYSLAYDVAMMNACTINVRRAAGGDIVRLDHLDVTRFRSGVLGEDGKPSRYYWCSNWARQREGARFAPKPLEVYNDSVKAEAVIYSRGYRQGSMGDVYSIPWWIGAINAAEVWAKIDAYNATQIDTGFSASVHLHTYTNRPDSELDTYDEKVMRAYSGARGRGIFHTYGTPEEGAPLLTKLDRGDHAGELDEIRDGAERVIYNAYGMPGILMGIETKTGMDGASKALSQAQAQVQAMLIRPKQQLITKALVRVLNDKGLTNVWEGKFDQMDIVEPGKDEVFARMAAMAAMDKNEYRVRELDLPPREGDEWSKPLNSGGNAPTDTPAQ